MPGTQVNPSGITDIKTDNEVRTYAEILIVIKSYAKVRGEKQWEMLKVACKARATYGSGSEAESQVRALFVKAFEEVREDKSVEAAHDTILQSDKGTAYRVTKIAFTFEGVRLERMKKDGLTFADVYRRAVEERKALEGKGKSKQETDDEPVSGDVTPAARGHPQSSYTSPEAGGQQGSDKNTDEWLEESLHIIDDDHTFPRFLKMIKEAKKSDILAGQKLEMLKKVLIGSLIGLIIFGNINFLIYGIDSDFIEKALGLEDNAIEKAWKLPNHNIEKSLPKLYNKIYGPRWNS